MILDSITLENFGAYGGRQEANLTPAEGKPIILFGGMNGGGKTTLLDAIQLAFYGRKAHLSNRGRLGYSEYLRQTIHRGSDPGEGACITIRFRRLLDGVEQIFELQRMWREGIKGIEETVRVLRDGVVDDVITDHWDETIEAYLPSGIAHLFFFDGEQIKDLADGEHAAEILGTAIHSLLGLDLVDRLEADLKHFERRKKTEGLDPVTAQKLAQARGELQEIDRQQEKAADEGGALVNEAGRLAKDLRSKEEQFEKEGGELYLRRHEFEAELFTLQTQKKETESKLRALVAGPLPLLLVESLLYEVQLQAEHETEIIRAKVLNNAMEARDADIVEALKKIRIPADIRRKVEQTLEADRLSRVTLADEPVILGADEAFAPRVSHLRGVVLPAAQQEAEELVAKLALLDEKITRIEADLNRIPPSERIAVIQIEIEAVRTAHQSKLAELEAVRVRQEALKRQRQAAEARLDRLGQLDVDARVADDGRQRMLKHSQRVRETLGRLRAEVVRSHTGKMEGLMLESFQKLLRKTGLVTSLSINPENFQATLQDREGRSIPVDRLSAGERQLLATSLLWGLARASGRPLPTIIDTPLGRLDSSHRRHLIERYFPNASHQVLLLSTDEEIVGKYFEALRPFVTRSYLLYHDEKAGHTSIQEGYFE